MTPQSSPPSNVRPTRGRNWRGTAGVLGVRRGRPALCVRLVSTTALKAMCERVGSIHVRTYIASGDVVIGAHQGWGGQIQGQIQGGPG